MTSTLFSSGTVVASTWLNDVDKSTYNTLSAVAGTNTITATGPVSATSYTTGLRFFFNPQNTNTGATTLNVSGLGAKAITKRGSTALVAGDLVAGMEAFVYYDGTQFQLINPRNADVTSVTGTLPIANGGTGATDAATALVNLGAIGRLIGVQQFSASGTYTPTTGTTSIIVEAIGGGGGSGGTNAPAAGQVSVGGAGGAGGYGKTRITSGFSGQAVTIGAAGAAGVAGGAGGAGGATIFMTLTCNGGAGGASGAASALAAAAGGAGGTVVGGTIIGVTGGQGDNAIASFASGFINGARGADSIWGSGGPNQVVSASGGNAVGLPGVGRGSGAGGATTGAGGGAVAGAAGTAGYLIIYEYS